MARTPRTRALATFGLNVRKRREALELSQVDAAEQCELNPTYISGSCCGKFSRDALQGIPKWGAQRHRKNAAAVSRSRQSYDSMRAEAVAL